MPLPPSCRLCASIEVGLRLDFGPQALSNRYLTSADPRDAAEEETFSLALGQCAECGLLQLLDPAPAEALRPRVDWIRYNEAEGHLDEVVHRVLEVPPPAGDLAVGAVSFKDDSTADRFRSRGCREAWRLDPVMDLGIDDPCAGLETLQERLTPELARAIAARRGRADLLVVRHVLEHAQRPMEFAAALRELIRPEGRLVVEVPDCEPALTRRDYTMPWEEHVSYFTPDLFGQGLALLGFEVLHQACYPYGNENSLVALVRPAKDARFAAPNPAVAGTALDLVGAYAAELPARRQALVERLTRCRAEGGRIAVFGAGHLTCAWINFLNLASCLDFVVDDHPKKSGLFMPGSRLPILPSTALLERGVRLCLTGLNAESEARVVARHQAFLDAGGRFASLFPGRPNSLMV